jgi:hypothetical protein
MRHIVLFFGVLMVLSPLQVTATENRETDIVFVVDPQHRTCERWIKDRKSGGEDEKEDIAWVYGFFSGYNEFGPKSKSPFLDYDGIHLLEQVDKVCATNPKIHVARAAMMFIESQKRKAKQ